MDEQLVTQLQEAVRTGLLTKDESLMILLRHEEEAITDGVRVTTGQIQNKFITYRARIDDELAAKCIAAGNVQPRTEY